MTEDRRKRLNELAGSFDKLSSRRALIKEFGNYPMPFTGENADGELVILHIAETSIIVETFQKNGWVRKNFYDENGNDDGETYAGRHDRCIS